MTVEAQLRDAALALAAGDLRRALAALLDAWRGSRAPRIAELVHHVSDELTRTLPPIAGKSVAARMTAWTEVARARDAADVGRLAVEPPPKKYDHAAAMIDAWLAMDPDPRVAIVLANYLENHQVPTDAGYELVHRALRRLGAIGDVRVLARVRADLATKRVPRMHVAHHEAITALEVIEPAPVDEAAVAAIEAHLRPAVASATDRADHEAEFLAAIFADPTARGPIVVYGDWLSEKGDPRGELIALQLQHEDGALTVKGETRLRKLLAEHAATWVGPLGRWFRPEDRRFERGFFAGGRLDRGVADEILAEPAWSMVRVLEISPHVEPLAHALLARGHVRAIGVVTEPFAEVLAIGDPATRIEELHWIVAGQGAAGWGADPTGPLATFAGMAHLKALAPRGTVEAILPWCERAPVVERLERLILDTRARPLVEAIGARAGVRVIEFGSGRFGRATGWNITIAREGAGPFTSILARWVGAKNELAHFAYTLTYTLAALPESWPRTLTFDVRSTAKLDLPDAARASLDAAVDRFTQLDPCSRPWR